MMQFKLSAPRVALAPLVGSTDWPAF